jgi:DnaK suppressor protein
MKQATTVVKGSKAQRKVTGNTNSTVANAGEFSTDKSDDLTIEALIPTLKESLLFQKSSILNKTHEFKKLQSENVQLSDEAEVASNDLSQNLSIHLHERDLNALVQIEKALGKINAGTYGECECCSDMINTKRLQARPLATLCIACMEDLEEQKKRVQQ